MKIILSIILSIILFPTIAYGAFTSPWYATSTSSIFIQPNSINGTVPSIRAPWFIATSTTATSTFQNLTIGSGSLVDYGTSNLIDANGNIIATVVPLSGTAAALAAIVPLEGERVYITDTMETKIGDGVTAVASLVALGTGSGGGTGTVSTSTVPTVGQLPYWTSNGYPSLLGSVATTSVSCSGSVSCTGFNVLGASPITISAIVPSYDWKQENNVYSVNSLTPTSTIPINIKSTATSTFAGGLEAWRQIAAPYFQATSTTDSTFAGRINTSGTTGGYMIDGSLVLQASTTNNSTLVGKGAGSALLSGGLHNTAVGYYALNLATSSDDNTAVGYYALGDNTTGYSNTALGYFALQNNTTGYSNVAIGGAALNALTTGRNNVAIGPSALYTNVSGIGNFGIGSNALENAIENYNVAIGTSALRGGSTITGSVAIGYGAGDGDGTLRDENSLTDDYATFIGYTASRKSTVASTTGLTGAMAFGYAAKVAQTYSLALGGEGNRAIRVGIGTSTPLARLSVNGIASDTYPLVTIATSTGTATTTVFNIDSSGTNDTKYGIFCELYVADTSAVQSIPNGTMYTKSTALASTTLNSTKYCTPSATNQNITITNAGRYNISGSFSFSSDTAAVIRGTVFVGGVEQSNIHFARKVPVTDVGNAGFTGIFTATSSSVVDLRLRHDAVGATNIGIQYGNLNVEYIGE